MEAEFHVIAKNAAFKTLLSDKIESCKSTLHRVQWIRTSNPTSIIYYALMAQVRIPVVRDITWRSQQLKKVLFLEKNPFVNGRLWTLEPPLSWERWTKLLKLAMLAKEGISIDT